MIKIVGSENDFGVQTKYFVNRGTKGHRTLHIYNCSSCYYSRPACAYEEFETVEDAMNSDPVPQMCKNCFPKQNR